MLRCGPSRNVWAITILEWEPEANLLGMAEVVSVDPFSVTFNFTDFANERCTEPLDRLELDWDAINNRRLVIVRGIQPGRR